LDRRQLVARFAPRTPIAVVHRMRPAQVEALAGTSLLVFSAFRRGGMGLLAFLGATALIVHATVSRAKEGFR